MRRGKSPVDLAGERLSWRGACLRPAVSMPVAGEFLSRGADRCSVAWPDLHAHEMARPAITRHRPPCGPQAMTVCVSGGADSPDAVEIRADAVPESVQFSVAINW